MTTSPSLVDMIQAVDSICSVLHRVSGVGEFEARVCAYYTLATWAMAKIDPFPLLAIIGPTGSGKTSLLDGLALLVNLPMRFSAGEITASTFRQNLADAHEKCALIDEGGSDSISLENDLLLRYARSTAFFEKSEMVAIGVYRRKRWPMWGPSIVVRREPFRDAALESRSILILTRADITRKYIPAKAIPASEIDSIKKKLEEIGDKVIFPDSIPIPENILPRVSDSYYPVTALATLAQDDAFLTPLYERLEEASSIIRQGQAFEPTAIVLQVLISKLSTEEGELRLRPVKVEAEILKIVRQDYGLNVTPWQGNKILRELGFKVKLSGGPNRVYADLPTLVAACKKAGVVDEVVINAKLSSKLFDPWELEEP